MKVVPERYPDSIMVDSLSPNKRVISRASFSNDEHQKENTHTIQIAGIEKMTEEEFVYEI